MSNAAAEPEPSSFDALGIQHFYYLLLEELHQRAGLLQAQARHTGIVASFLAAERVAGAGSSISAVARAATAVEEHLATIAEALRLDLTTLAVSTRPPPFQQILDHRIEYLAALTNTLGYQRTLQRALAAELDSLPPDYARPAAIHGLEQFEILKATNDVAFCYGRLMLEVARRSVLQHSELQFAQDNIILTFEPLPFPRQRDYVPFPPDTQDNLYVFVRLPVWYCYMPRYHPNIAHEFAHAVIHRCSAARNSVAYQHRRLMTMYGEALDEAIRCTATPDVTEVFANLGTSMLEELLADLLALRVAGPAYILSLAVATIGAKRLSTDQHLSTPMRVRLRLLLASHERLAAERPSPTWRKILAIVNEDIEAYDEHGRQQGHHAKLRYQRALHDISRRFLDEVHDLWRLGTYSGESPDGPAAEPSASNHFHAFLSSLRQLPQYAGLRIPFETPEIVEYLAEGRLEHASGIIWLLYFANATGPLRDHSDPFVPEGRIFHEWHRYALSGLPAKQADMLQPTVGSSGTAESKTNLGQYWEFLFHQVLWSPKGTDPARGDHPFKLMREALEHELRLVHECDAPTGTVFSVFGLYDFLTVRQRFEAKRFLDWPPASRLPYPYFPHRHIAQEVLEHRSSDGISFVSTLSHPSKPGDLLAVSLLKFRSGVGRNDMLARALAAESVQCVGVLLSLGWEDLVVIWRLQRPSDAEALTRHFAVQAGTGILDRTVTQLLVVPGPAPPLAEGHSGDLRTPGRLHIRMRATRDRELAAVERAINERTIFKVQAYCSGRYDLLCSLEATDVGELNRALDDLDMLTGEGFLVESETSFLAGVGGGDS